MNEKKKIKILPEMPAAFVEDIICLVKVINQKNNERIDYWKNCVNQNIDEALRLELITKKDAIHLRRYYELEKQSA